MENNIKIPPAFIPDCDFSSHRPMLYMALRAIKGLIFEFGCGFGSTGLLQQFCSFHTDYSLESFETNVEWGEVFQNVNIVPNYFKSTLIPITHKIPSIVFIDSAPAEDRKLLIEDYRDLAKIIIVHDTEPGAEYIYKLSDTLNSFKFRCDLIVEGLPQTTAVSNCYDFKNWVGIYNDQYIFACLPM